MKNMMNKSTLREISGSMSRWIAILAICALGVGFFVGLKVCREAYIKTGDDYLESLNFFDFEVISTLGIDEENIAELKELDGVSEVEGSYSTDCLFEVDANAVQDVDNNLQMGSKVAKIFSIMDNINKVELKGGRMPANANECVVDYDRFDEAVIGQKIRISDTNEDSTIEMFKYDEYEITGLVSSPLYLNYERGSTKLGDGSVSCYIYIPKDGWDMDVYTEAYINMPARAQIFSAEYDEQSERLEKVLTDRFDVVAQSRYDDVLKDARKELAEAKKKIRDGEKELADSEKTLAEYEKKINDAKAEIAENEQKLKDGKKEVEENEAKLIDGKREVAENEKKLIDGKNEIADNEKKLEDAEKEIAENEAKLDAGQAELDKNIAEFKSEQSKFELIRFLLPASQVAEYEAQLKEGKETIDAYQAEIDSGREQIAAAKEEVITGRAEIEKAKEDVITGEAEIKKAKEEIADGEIEIEKAKKEISDGERELQKGKREVADGEREIADAKVKIADGRAELADGRAEYDDAKKQVEDLESPDTYVLGRDTNIGYLCFDNDTSIVEGIAKVFPVFFLLVAALVVMTTMTRMIDEQRTQIGVLKALGYSRRKILQKYVFYSGSAALIGGITGFLIGSYLFPWTIWEAYGMMYGFADLIPVINWKVGGASIAVAFICAVGTTVYSCWYDLREVPAQLIRPKAPQTGKRILLERIGFIWNRLSFLHKVSARNIFRYKKRFFMMILGICGCTALLVTGFGISDSIKNVVSAQYDDIYRVDYTASFDNDITEEDRISFCEDNRDVISDSLFLYTISCDARHNEKTKSVTLVVCDDIEGFDKFIDLHTEPQGPNRVKKHIEFPEYGKCVINTNLAINLGLKEGDTIRITDSDMNELTAEITELCENHIYNYMYITADTYGDSWGEFETNAAYLIGYDEEEGNEQDVITDKSVGGAKLMNDERISGVSVTKEFEDRVNNMMKALDFVIALIIACAGALAFIVLYNLTNINITERIREIATIKVLGFYPMETAQYVFRENIVLTAISAIVGLPIGKALHYFVMSQIQIDMISFDIHITTISYIMSILMTFAFALIVNIVMYFKLDRINMAESLKSIE